MMRRALAVFCRHGIMWGAQILRDDAAQTIIGASVWLNPDWNDWLQVVPSEQVRRELAPCADCGMPA